MRVEKEDLQDVLDLLNEAKKLHEGGYYEAHRVAEKARQLLQKIIDEG
jgi:energy-converting hydrogenase A subunit M